MLIATAMAVVFAATAHAANYRMALCAANNGSNSFQTATNTTSPQNPGGIFSFENYCGPAPFPAGNDAFLRIAENQGSGNAGQNAYGSISWTVPPWVDLAAGGGYTREPGSFNDGWRGRFWLEGWDGSTNNVLVQGSGVQNGDCGGVCWATTPVFASHLWPFGGYGKYRRFVFELTCMRPAGCDRSGWNAVDANTMILTLADVSPAQIGFTDGQVLSGDWVRGSQGLGWSSSDQGSGMRFESLRLDDAAISHNDYRGSCDIDSNGGVGEFARQFSPCPVGGPWGHGYTLNTAGVPDGAHTLQVCAQDYGQAAGLDGAPSASCDQRTIRTDNTAPGKPAALAIRSANPNRYLDHFGATFSLPPNSGSPITQVHYQVLNAAGEVLVATKTVSATNPSEVANLEGPAKPGAYRLKLWLTDQVGFDGPAAEVDIPHDTTPPAAPQDLAAIGPASWGPAQGYSLRWRDVVDNGSPIDTTRYQVLDGAGSVVVPTQTVSGTGVQTLDQLQTPAQRGDYAVRLWLADAEGNVGAPATAPLPRDTTPPAAPQGLAITPPATSRAADGFDLRWRNLTDDGSPIAAAHYQVLDGSGKVVVATQTANGEGVSAIGDLETPSPSGNYQLRLWLTDAEGNAGAPVTAPLSYDCVRSEATGGSSLSAGFSGHRAQTVQQGQGSVLSGSLRRGDGGPLANAPLCLYSRVATDQGREFLGIALTDSGGSYRFPIPAGPSRELSTIYRPDQRQLSASATLNTVVHPTLRARATVVKNKHWAYFEGEIPGPHNDDVTVVLQVKSGKGWLAFRRYRTRDDGHFEAAYYFRRTTRATTYEMRAQIREAGGYPYAEGDSDPIVLRVVPDRAKASAKRTGKAKRSHGKHRRRHSHLKRD